MESKILILCLLGFFIGTCDYKTSPESLDTYYNSLFKRTGNGFTGGDATYSIKLPNGKIVWIFGDTFLGTIENNGTRKKMDPIYIRNSFVVQDGNKMETLLQGTLDKPKSLLVPPHVDSNTEITEDSVWYWPGDATLQQGELKVFLSEFKQVESDMWGFEWQRTAIASFDVNTMETLSLVELPRSKTGKIHFGHAIYEEEEFVYLYGLNEGYAYAARVLNGNFLGKWEYANGDKWVEDVSNATPILDENISEQFTVIKHKDFYYLISQLGDLSNEVWSYKSKNPIKWSKSNGKKIRDIKMPYQHENIFTYNTLVHPHLMDDQEKMLYSFNTNTFELEEHFTNADIYRPRFFLLSPDSL